MFVLLLINMKQEQVSFGKKKKTKKRKRKRKWETWSPNYCWVLDECKAHTGEQKNVWRSSWDLLEVKSTALVWVHQYLKRVKGNVFSFSVLKKWTMWPPPFHIKFLKQKWTRSRLESGIIMCSKHSPWAKFSWLKKIFTWTVSALEQNVFLN